MRLSTAVVAVITALITILVLVPGNLAPQHTTARDLAADPSALDGKLVTFSVTALESGPDDKTMVYRRFANRPPVLIVEFTTAPPRRPSVVVGTVRAGNPVRVVNCRPAP